MLSTGLSRVFSSTTIWKQLFFGTQPSLWPDSHMHATIGKMRALTRLTFVDKVMSLLFNMLSRFVIVFLPRSYWTHGSSHHLQWFGAQENKVFHCFHFSQFVCHEVMRLDDMTLVFWMLSFKPAFSLNLHDNLT